MGEVEGTCPDPGGIGQEQGGWEYPVLVLDRVPSPLLFPP